MPFPVRSLSAVLLLVLPGLTVLHAQTATAYPLRTDVESLDAIVHAFYDVVSTPAGALPNYARDSSLHAPGAQIRLSRVRPGGERFVEVLTLPEFYARYYRTAADRGFHEREIHRVAQRFGSIAHVWSTYEASESPGGPTIARGISTLHLWHDGSRWWITGWMDERESPNQPLPGEYLPK